MIVSQWFMRFCVIGQKKLCCEMAFFRVRNRLFRVLIKYLSHSETVHIVMPNGLFCKVM